MVLSIEYIAGFFDGEGSIGIYNSESNRKYMSYVLAVSLGQIEPTVVTYLKEKYGGSIWFNERSKKMKNRQDAWYWRISGQKALAFLIAIAPYSIVKKSQIQLAIEFMRQRNKQGERFSQTGNVDRGPEFHKRMKEMKRAAKIVPLGLH